MGTIMLSKTSEEYILIDTQWPNYKTTITYSFADRVFYSDANRESELGPVLDVWDRRIVRDAMDAWEAVCGVEFVEVRDSPLADVRVAWMPSWESDGPDGVFGVTSTWSHGSTITEQTVTIDPAEAWHLNTYEILVDGGDEGFFRWDGGDSFYDTVLHELGHVLGIDHSNVRGVVLSGTPNTPYTDHPGRDVLQPDDIAAARAIWGLPNLTGPTSGPDRLHGGAGDDSINGGAGNDKLYGGAGNDKLYGGAGNDNIIGEGGNDTLLGGAGDDYLYGRAGNDILLGGAGVDWIWGGTGNDRIWSEAGGGHLFGGPGQDILFGGAGYDVMAGGSGDDILLGGAGNDTLDGGVGHAAYEVGYLDGNDRIWGEAGNDYIRGHDGNDFLAGGMGNDTLYGGDGSDYLAGGPGNDTLDSFHLYYGGTGVDVLAGGAGNDRLIGGDEGDTFFGQAGADTFVIRSGVNWVMDFEDADRLDIGMTLAQVQAASIQHGEHLHIHLPGGGDLNLAYTTIADLDADNLI